MPAHGPATIAAVPLRQSPMPLVRSGTRSRTSCRSRTPSSCVTPVRTVDHRPADHHQRIPQLRTDRAFAEVDSLESAQIAVVEDLQVALSPFERLFQDRLPNPRELRVHWYVETV